MEIRTGTRLGCTQCATQIVVVSATLDSVAITCDGHPMQSIEGVAGDEVSDTGLSELRTLVGKRYSKEGLEVLCTRSGSGVIELDGRPMVLKEAKPLPSSD